ncbi:MAG: tyrosine-protein phosphatase [Acidimicrobiales bacterium]
MLPAAPERHLPFEGCFNFRDLGGYRSADGRRVRWRVLFRADGLHRLTPGDLRSLRELGLRTVIDLRTADEVNDRGRLDADPGLRYHHLPMFDVLPPAEELPLWERPEFVAAEYRRMLAAGSATVARVLELLADPAAYPVAYHCFAGKDRTGIMSAVVLELLGVADEDIVADYALSRQGMARMLAWWRERSPDRAAEIDASASAIAAAEPASMAAFLDSFRADHGSAEAYAATLGLEGVGDRLRHLLLEDS